MKIICSILIVVCLCHVIDASTYGINAIVSGSLTVTGNTILSNNVQIGSSLYAFPSSPPTSSGQVLGASSIVSPYALSWIDQTPVSLSTGPASTGSSIVITGTSPLLSIAGVKGGSGISVSGPTSDDIIISSTIIQTAVTFPIIYHPTGATPNSALIAWPGWSSLVPSLSTTIAPSSCTIYGSGANTVKCDLTNNSGSGTPQCVNGANNDLEFTTALPTDKSTCSAAFIATLAGNTLQTLSLTCSGNIRSVYLICTI